MFYITPKETTWKISVEYIKKEIRRGLIHITRKKKVNEIGGKGIRDERRDKRLQDIWKIINKLVVKSILSIITLNVNGLNFPRYIDLLND